MVKPVWFSLVSILLGVTLGSAPARLFADGSENVSKQSTAALADWLDDQFEVLWKAEGLKPAEVVDDAVFLRRVYLDLVGTIPSVSQTRDFFDDSSPSKRAKLVDRLILQRRSAEHLARIWRRELVPGNSPGAAMSTRLEPWLTDRFAENTAYDELARGLVTATGTVNVRAAGGSPLVFFQAVGNSPDAVADAVSRVFLGVRLGCAKCHDHPFTAWKQQDFWGMAAFFAGINQDGRPNAAVANNKLAKITPKDSQIEYTARFLWGGEAEIPANKFPRDVFAEWMTSAENPNFSATAVNRFWRHLCGRGIVSSVDDLDGIPAEERALVLDELAERFAGSGFDVRWLIAGVCKSKVYQRESASADDKVVARLCTHRPLKTLTPDQVFDSLEQALALPVSRNDGSPRHNGQRAQLVARLNESASDSPEQFRAGIPQALLIMNGELTASATSLDKSRTLRAVVDAPFLTPAAKIETLYLAAFTRRPQPNELEIFLKHVDGQPNKQKRREAYGEIFWGLLNSPEFVLSR